MSYSKLLLTCIFAVLFSVSAYAQCPPGWNTYSMPFGPDPSGCTWQVEFCTKCSVTGVNPLSIKVLNIAPVPPGGGCLGPDKDWLVDQLINHVYSVCITKPCDEGCTTYIIEYPSCWQWRTRGNLNQGVYTYTSWYAPCPGSGYCQITTKRCKDPNPPGYIIPCPDWDDIYQEYNVTCPDIVFPDEPTEFDPDFEGEMQTGPCIKLYDCYFN